MKNNDELLQYINKDQIYKELERIKEEKLTLQNDY